MKGYKVDTDTFVEVTSTLKELRAVRAAHSSGNVHSSSRNNGYCG